MTWLARFQKNVVGKYYVLKKLESCIWVIFKYKQLKRKKTSQSYLPAAGSHSAPFDPPPTHPQYGRTGFTHKTAAKRAEGSST